MISSSPVLSLISFSTISSFSTMVSSMLASISSSSISSSSISGSKTSFSSLVTSSSLLSSLADSAGETKNRAIGTLYQTVTSGTAGPDENIQLGFPEGGGP